MENFKEIEKWNEVEAKLYVRIHVVCTCACMLCVYNLLRLFVYVWLFELAKPAMFTLQLKYISLADQLLDINNYIHTQ